MTYSKYIDIMARCASLIFQEMCGCGVLGVKARPTGSGGLTLPAARVVAYEHRSDDSVRGYFIFGFTDTDAAVEAAGAIGRRMGLPPITEFNDLAADVVNEFLNSWIGRTFSAWEGMENAGRLRPPLPACAGPI